MSISIFYNSIFRLRGTEFYVIINTMKQKNKFGFLLVILVCLILPFVFAACGSNDNNIDNTDGTNNTEDGGNEENGTQITLAYVGNYYQVMETPEEAEKYDSDCRLVMGSYIKDGETKYGIHFGRFNIGDNGLEEFLYFFGAEVPSLTEGVISWAQNDKTYTLTQTEIRMTISVIYADNEWDYNWECELEQETESGIEYYLPKTGTFIVTEHSGIYAYYQEHPQIVLNADGTGILLDGYTDTINFIYTVTGNDITMTATINNEIQITTGIFSDSYTKVDMDFGYKFIKR